MKWRPSSSSYIQLGMAMDNGNHDCDIIHESRLDLHPHDELPFAIDPRWVSSSIHSSSSCFNMVVQDLESYDQRAHVQEEQPHDHQGGDDEEEEELGAMKEMMYKIAAMQPVDIDPATIRKPKRKNIWISNEPQSVAARHRRERISDRIRILQRLVPGGTKMDTASMLEEATRYVKFLRRQIRVLQSNPSHHHLPQSSGMCLQGWPTTISSANTRLTGSSLSNGHGLEELITFSMPSRRTRGGDCDRDNIICFTNQ
ncbi:hypothetical protein Drorol1_Dr00021925 [Drosera rotundifolia]